MDKWLRDLLLLSIGALLAFGLFAVLHFTADRPALQLRWEAYAAACLIGAVFGFAVVRAVSFQAEKLASLERKVAALENSRTTQKPPESGAATNGSTVQ